MPTVKKEDGEKGPDEPQANPEAAGGQEEGGSGNNGSSASGEGATGSGDGEANGSKTTAPPPTQINKLKFAGPLHVRKDRRQSSSR